MLSQEQKQVNFNDYLSSWKPDMSQQEYVDLAVNNTTAAQNTAYDNIAIAIQKRLANQLGGYNNQLADLPGQYKPIYEQKH